MFLAKDCKPRAANVDHRSGRHLQGEHVAFSQSQKLTRSFKFEKTTAELVSNIRTNAKRYIDLFSDVVDDLMPPSTKDISDQDEVIDVILHQRRERNQRWRIQTKTSFHDICFEDSASDVCSCRLTRPDFINSNLYFQPLFSDEAMAVRDVKGTHLGRLITVRGIVTRVSEVKPLILVNAYTCDVCGAETFQDIKQKQFTPIVDCQNELECKRNGIPRLSAYADARLPV